MKRACGRAYHRGDWLQTNEGPISYDMGVTGNEIKALRQELRCTPKELASALGVSQKTVMAWEAQSLFPTKRHVQQLSALRDAGPSCVPRLRTKASLDPLEQLADPQLWKIFRKLIAYPQLRSEVAQLAQAYDDPKSPAEGKPG